LSSEGSSTIGSITIRNSVVTASSALDGTGIGSGCCSQGSSVDTITIVESIVESGVSASNSRGGSGIGSGHTSSGNSSVGAILITLSYIACVLSGSDVGSGIGSGPSLSDSDSGF
jgi:hypothetical protein